MTERAFCPTRRTQAAWSWFKAVAAIGSVLLLATAVLGGIATSQAAFSLEGPLEWSLVLLFYTTLTAVPFVPDIELELFLLMAAGPGGAPLVSTTTVIGLGLAFSSVRCLPVRWKAAIPPLPEVVRPGRHALLALAFNVHGDRISGGGGGLAMANGVSRASSAFAFLLTAAVETAPAPPAFILYSGLP